MVSSAIDPYVYFILIRTDRKLNNNFQQTKEVLTGTLQDTESSFRQGSSKSQKKDTK